MRHCRSQIVTDAYHWQTARGSFLSVSSSNLLARQPDAGCALNCSPCALFVLTLRRGRLSPIAADSSSAGQARVRARRQARTGSCAQPAAAGETGGQPSKASPN
jgi:hypothetical protein